MFWPLKPGLGDKEMGGFDELQNSKKYCSVFISPENSSGCSHIVIAKVIFSGAYFNGLWVRCIIR